MKVLNDAGCVRAATLTHGFAHIAWTRFRRRQTASEFCLDRLRVGRGDRRPDQDRVVKDHAKLRLRVAEVSVLPHLRILRLESEAFPRSFLGTVLQPDI